MKENEFYKTLGAFLRNERKRRNLTVTDVAKRLHVGKSTIAYYETCERAISVFMLKQYADILGYTIDEIFSRI